jgi:DNA-binding transcriptional MerR regulator
VQIGELARRSGLSAKTIRFYEQAGVLPEPARTPGGYRDYGPAFVERLDFVRRAQAAGLTLKQVAQILAIRDRGDAPCGHVREVLHERLDQVRANIAELITLETHLQALLDNAERQPATAHDNSGVCWILEADI